MQREEEREKRRGGATLKTDVRHTLGDAKAAQDGVPRGDTGQIDRHGEEAEGLFNAHVQEGQPWGWEGVREGGTV